MELTHDERRVLEVLIELTKEKKIFWMVTALGAFEANFDGLTVCFIENSIWGPEVTVTYCGPEVLRIVGMDVEMAEEFSNAVVMACKPFSLGLVEEILNERRLK